MDEPANRQEFRQTFARDLDIKRDRNLYDSGGGRRPEPYPEKRRKETGALELDHGGLASNRLPRKLTGLTSLQFLNLTGCEKLSQKPPKPDHPQPLASIAPEEDRQRQEVGRTAVPNAGKGEVARGSRQDRAQVRRPDFPPS